MNDVRFLEASFGGRWCGVKFGPSEDPASRPAARPMRFCEAVAESRKGPIVLTPDLMNCPGGSRCLGWTDDEEESVRAMAVKSGLDVGVANQIIRNTPRLDNDVRRVTVGTYDAPDIALSYAQPGAAMGLLRDSQRMHGRPLALHASGFLSVCGAVAVKTYLTGEICISFGCPDARKHGEIGRDRLVIGIPIPEVERIRRANRSAHNAQTSTASP